MLEATDDSAPKVSGSPEESGNSTLSGYLKYDPRTSPPALLRAVYRGDSEEVRSLLAAENDIEARHPTNGRTAAMIAASLGDTEILEILLKSGASVVSADDTLRTALHYAASEGMSDCVNLLLSYEAPTDCKDFTDEIPLHRAVRYDRAEITKILLARQHDPLMPWSQFRQTILHIAVLRENVGITKLILDHIRTTEHRQDCSNSVDLSHNCDCPVVYPNIDVQDVKGDSALQLAINYECAPLVALLLRFSPSEVDCRRRRRDWTSKDSFNPVPWERALHYSVEISDLELLKILLAGGANPSLLNSDNQTPLEVAIHRNNEEATTILLTHGESYMANSTEQNNLSLLEAAVKTFGPAILDRLVTSRSDLDFSMSTAARAVLRQAQLNGRWERFENY
jgi:ankyrin repeat protein